MNSTSDPVRLWYDSVGPVRQQIFDDLFGGSGFLNFGFWRDDTASARDACENLMREIVAQLPDGPGRVLDVGCGNGATTRSLAERFGEANVTGINVSEEQLAQCRARAPGCSFSRMDATKLDFEDASFDHAVSVEAAFHFETREAFLAETLRVLRPGGRLVLTDMLLPRWSRIQPGANWVADIAGYRALCEGVGFDEVRVRDITDQSWKPFVEHARRYFVDGVRAGTISPGLGALAALWARHVACRSYLLVTLRKASDESA